VVVVVVATPMTGIQMVEEVLAETDTFTFNGCTTTNPGIIRGHIAGVFQRAFIISA
jgi:hypothetical protein